MVKRVRREIPGLGYAEFNLSRRRDIRVGDRLLPPWADVTVTDPGGQWEMVLRLEVIDSVPRCRSLSLTAKDPCTLITDASLRRVSVEDITRRVYQAIGARITTRRGSLAVVEGLGDQSREGWPTALRMSRRRTRKITPDFLAEVARVYRDHIADTPTKAVSEAFDVSTRMASVYVRQARDLGLLPQTTRGKKLA